MLLCGSVRGLPWAAGPGLAGWLAVICLPPFLLPSGTGQPLAQPRISLGRSMCRCQTGTETQTSCLPGWKPPSAGRGRQFSLLPATSPSLQRGSCVAARGIPNHSFGAFLEKPLPVFEVLVGWGWGRSRSCLPRGRAGSWAPGPPRTRGMLVLLGRAVAFEKGDHVPVVLA